MAYSLLERVGLELEYAIVDRETLDVRPFAPLVLGENASETEHPPLAWSNELVQHVIEVKNPVPTPSLINLTNAFIAQVGEINEELKAAGACLLPTGAHPWMDPMTETRLWQAEQTEIYRAYDRIFGTQGHGWSNLQSAHLNLSFATSQEFGLLQAAVRPVLALIPGLSASTPFLDRKPSGFLDSRLEVYKNNQNRIPFIAGDIIPEPIYSIDEYEDQVLQPMYRAIAPYDPEGLLQEEWLNSRGAIPKFSRDSLEIRIIDLQSHPAFDLVVTQAIFLLLKHLVNTLSGDRQLRSNLEHLSQDSLVSLYQQATRDASTATLPPDLAGILNRIMAVSTPGIGDGPEPITLRKFWTTWLTISLTTGDFGNLEDWAQKFLNRYRAEGTEAEVLITRYQAQAPSYDLKRIYRDLAKNLPQGN